MKERVTIDPFHPKIVAKVKNIYCVTVLLNFMTKTKHKSPCVAKIVSF